jgi:phosphonate transport system permease protein
MTDARRTLSFDDEAAIVARFPEQFRIDWTRRAKLIGGATLALGLFVFGVMRLEIPFDRLAGGTGRLIEFVGLMLPPDPGSWQLAEIYLQAMGETLAIAFLGTLGGAVLAFPVSFLAARNVLGIRALQLLVRRLLDAVRGIDTLIWALIWVGVVGLGPFAGILAVMCSDFGNFGKLFSEAFEAADHKPIEGVKATGGSHLHNVRFGLLPQVVPILASQVLYFFESNTRSATIIGIVGAGGIGLQLAEQIRVLEWQKVSFLILMIMVTVASIDWLSTRLRFAIIGRRAVG